MMHLYQSNLAGTYCRAKNESSCLKHASNIPRKKRLCKDRLAGPNLMVQVVFHFYFVGVGVMTRLIFVDGEEGGKGKKKRPVPYMVR